MVLLLASCAAQSSPSASDCDASASSDSRCQGILDDKTTCVTTDRFYGNYADLDVNDSPSRCCAFCAEQYPATTHTDFFPNAGPSGWCNCYGSCAETRCVSVECHGSDGGSVTTQVLLASPPPIPPPQPLNPPAEPPLPPAPPLFIEGSEVVIEEVDSADAAKQLHAALQNTDVATVLLRVGVKVLPSTTFEVSRAVAIIGQCPGENRCEITGGGTLRLFSVEEAGELHLENLALKEGGSSQDGGALHLAEGAVAHVHNCSLESNTASGDGGAIFCAAGSSMHLSACTLTGGKAQGARGGGAIFASAGAFLSLSDCNCTGNFAEVNGGMLFADSGSAVELTRTALRGNVAGSVGSKGGAVYLFKSRFVMQGGSVLSGNAAAEGSGGGLFCYQECAVVMRDTEVADNLATESGGGLYGHSLTSFELGPNVSVVRNVVTGPWRGGGVAVYEDGIIRISQALVADNEAAGRGGGLYAAARSVVALEAGTIVERNHAAENGGGIYCGANALVQLQGGGVEVRQNVAAGTGGGLYLETGGMVNITAGMVVSNTAIEGGGVGCPEGDVVVNIWGSAAVLNNTATGGDGGGVLVGAGSLVEVFGGVLEHNWAPVGVGGGVAVGSDSAVKVLDDASVCHNRGTGGGGLYLHPRGSLEVARGVVVAWNKATSSGGGGVAAVRGELRVNASSMVANTASSEGGALACTDECDVVIAESVVEQNAGYFAGGVSVAAGSRLRVQGGSLVQNNTARKDAGGIHGLESTLELSEVVLRWNLAQQSGAGVYCEDGYVALSVGTLLMENTAQLFGGGVHAAASVLVAANGTRLERNTARYGGAGISVQEGSKARLANISLSADSALSSTGGCIRSEDGELDVEDAWLEGCEAEQGGGLAIVKGLVKISRSRVENCTASASAGGVYLQNTTAELEETVVRGCRAMAGGGVEVASAVISLVGFLLEANFASSYGGALILQAGSATVSSSVCTDNLAEDGGAFAVGEAADLEMENVEFHRNTAIGQGGGIYFMAQDAEAPLRAIALLQLTFVGVEGWAANILWVYTEYGAQSAPGCTDCVWPAGTDLLATTAMRFAVFQGGSVVSPSMQVVCVSGEVFDPPVIYRALDWYGNPVHPGLSTATALATGEQLAVSKKTIIEYEWPEGSTFAELQAQGVPGSVANLTLSAQSVSDWGAATVAVAVRACTPGETFLEAALQCEECPPGSIRFDNGTAPCVVCEEVQSEGITCLGGNRYEIWAGYWLAPNAQYCAADAECLLTKVYACETEKACEGADASDDEDPTPERIGAGVEAAAGLQDVLCNQQLYEYGVLCGGGVLASCGDGYYRSSGLNCVTCPSKSVTTTTIVLLSICCVLLLILILAFCFVYRILKAYLKGIDLTVVKEELEELGSALGRSRSIMQVLLGYLQVTGQLPSLYGKLVPPMLTQLMQKMHVINLDASRLINLTCLMHHFSPRQKTGLAEFWMTFWNAVASPWALLLLSWMCYFGIFHVYVHKIGEVKSPERLEKFRETLRMTCLGVALFGLMFVHPNVAVIMFELFNCEPYHFTATTVEGSGPYWVSQDLAIMCYTRSWYLGMVFACATVILFVFGFPFGTWWVMFKMRKWRRFRFRLDQLSPERLARLLDDGTFYCASIQPGSLLQQHLHHQTARKRGRKIWEFRKGKEEPEEPEEEEEEDPGVLQHSDELHGFNHEHMFLKVERVKLLPPSLEAGEDEPWQPGPLSVSSSMGITPGPSGPRLIPRLSRQMTKITREGNLSTVELSTRLAPLTIELSDGAQIDVEVWEKQDFGDDGAEEYVPVTKLDGKAVNSLLGQFTDDFEGRYYYWQCYEMVRRFTQTGVVLLVRMAYGELYSSAFALFVSVIALTLHTRCRPYIDDNIDSLTFLFLFNQFFIQFIFVCLFLDESEFELLGLMLMLMQLICMLYSAYLLMPTIRAIYHPMRKFIRGKPALLAYLMKKESTKIELENQLQNSSSKGTASSPSACDRTILEFDLPIESESLHGSINGDPEEARAAHDDRDGLSQLATDRIPACASSDQEAPDGSDRSESNKPAQTLIPQTLQPDSQELRDEATAWLALKGLQKSADLSAAETSARRDGEDARKEWRDKWKALKMKMEMDMKMEGAEDGMQTSAIELMQHGDQDDSPAM
ncbi:hypothetical protein CYMTET_13443 [Cymbomonas tetramitiformis]|uniref:Right handed beta helix domain-containing protein n=1 Tax=Cymbomonas tetramitiformis TaxID=36881 RepID=A0AAE0GIM2_9CHLO|nr:hypothetical protein CYMTET_13443 [Cymbomonas tetramitiformis]